MPNRRRRKLSTAMSAVAALAVASPCAYFLVYESTAGAKPAPEHHEFKQAAAIADLPGEVMSALSQGLSQFGINMPPVPALTGPGDTGNGLGTPGLTNPGLTDPGLTNPGLGTPGLPTPGTGLTTPGLTNPALTNPGLTSPIGTTPGLNPGTGEVPITTPASLDPGADGTYPILGDPSTLGGMSPTSPIGTGSNTSTGGGGIVNDVMQVANQLGANQVIDLLKGVLMPAIMQGVQNGGAAGGMPGAVTPPATQLVPVA
ncbi:hypothetical protein [Mycobacterium haemophilum]|uniref:Exported repetitive protein n=1 Tax=Mycobacterium haemophilum TaxID=29311 RepID=A0A0I9U276_9MYCO|nr:Exported repetitive protein [Mycobacterium haemophilum]KLO36126.1 Exported repetitive protein [Mycobacterium haemophilum]KLO41974.1 Exported repetitive protein [Mycobacterium haemophilum]KLO49884.1 Exported repetitive protein [Mycobacterium haemophilum]